LKNETQIEETDFTKNGLRKILIERNRPLIEELKILQEELAKVPEGDTAKKNAVDRKVKEATNKSKLVILVKNDKDATYENIIDVMDEFLITQVAKYFIVEEELAPLEKKKIDEKLKS
jgi:hypothetical protein